MVLVVVVAAAAAAVVVVVVRSEMLAFLATFFARDQSCALPGT